MIIISDLSFISLKENMVIVTNIYMPI